MIQVMKKFLFVIINLLFIFETTNSASTISKDAVDLPSFLESLTDLRSKLLNLLGGNLESSEQLDGNGKTNSSLAHDLVSNSIFQEGRKTKGAEKDALFKDE